MRTQVVVIIAWLIGYAGGLIAANLDWPVDLLVLVPIGLAFGIWFGFGLEWIRKSEERNGR